MCSLRAVRLKAKFIKLGFVSRSAFYNVCMGLDPQIRGFSLICFWHNNEFSDAFLGRLDVILNILELE